MGVIPGSRLRIKLGLDLASCDSEPLSRLNYSTALPVTVRTASEMKTKVCLGCKANSCILAPRLLY